jgi:hypothetical protein
LGLFGEKCGRCGRRTRHRTDDAPTCESCEAQLEAKLQADIESPRECPVDGAPMAKEIVQTIVIDRCPSCRGIWLDGGEFESIQHGIEAGAASVLMRGMVHPM